jgi:hypothetical protein
MFHIKSGNQSVLYTGDYNMTPDRHLGSAWVDRCTPDVLITESTYATIIRDSKRARERDFLRKVHETLKSGGKVLVPVFAVGRAQELAMLLEHYFERLDLPMPMYFVGGLTSKSLVYYRLFLHWTNEKLRHTLLQGRRNPWDFKRIRSLQTSDTDLSSLDADGPMVVFASPGMLHSGRSLEIFKKWAGSSRNMVILPGYCVPGTVGAHLLSHQPSGERLIPVPGEVSPIVTRLRVENLSFSAHADAKGILTLLRTCRPRTVVLVHGERKKMRQLREVIQTKLHIPTAMPANLQPLRVSTPQAAKVLGVSSGPLFGKLLKLAANRFAEWAVQDARNSGEMTEGIVPLHLQRESTGTAKFQNAAENLIPAKCVPIQMVWEEQEHGSMTQIKSEEKKLPGTERKNFTNIPDETRVIQLNLPFEVQNSFGLRCSVKFSPLMDMMQIGRVLETLGIVRVISPPPEYTHSEPFIPRPRLDMLWNVRNNYQPLWVLQGTSISISQERIQWKSCTRDGKTVNQVLAALEKLKLSYA